MQKNGTGEHIPPPRPKRKSSQPYPQKANSSGTVGPHGGGSSKGGGDVSKAAKKGGKGSSAGVSTGGMGSMAPSHEANMGRHGSPGAMGAPPPVGSVMQHSGGMSSMGMNGGGYPMATSVRPSWDAPGNTMRGPHPAGPGPMSSMGGDGYGMGGMVGTGDGGIPRMMGGSNSHGSGSMRREGQMLMGGGKTTVVGPLLALMLADGESLVVQTMPPALLEQSKATTPISSSCTPSSPASSTPR